MAEDDVEKAKTVLAAHDRLYDIHLQKMEKQPNRVFKKYKRPNGKSNVESMNLSSKPQQDFCITIPLKGAKGGVSYQLKHITSFTLGKRNSR